MNECFPHGRNRGVAEELEMKASMLLTRRRAVFGIAAGSFLTFD
jgi:hypothetical protein